MNDVNLNQQPAPPGEQPKSVKKRLWWPIRWLLKSTLGVILLVLLLVALIAGLLFTQSGLNVVLWGAQKALPQLTVQDSEGALLPEFTLRGVQLDAPEWGVNLEAKKLTLGVELECALKLSLCVDTLSADGFALSLFDTPNSEPPPSEPQSEPLTTIFIPLPIEVRQLALNDVKLDIFGTIIDWNSVDTSADFFGSELTLFESIVDGLAIEVAASETEEVNLAVQQTEQQPSAIELPEVLIPLSVDVRALTLRNVEYKAETPIIIERAFLVGKVKKHDVSVQQLEVLMPQIDAQLVGDISLNEGYPLDITLDATILQQEVKGQQLQIVLTNSVADLNFELLLSKLLSGEFAGQIQPLEPTLPFDLRAIDIQAFWPLFGESDYQVAVRELSTSGSLEGFDLAINGEIGGSAIAQVELSVLGSGDLTHIALSEMTLNLLGGSIAGEVAADWTELVNWQAELSFSTLQPGLQWPEAEGEISGRLQTSGGLTEKGGWQVELPMLDIDGILRDYPLKLTGALQASDVEGSGDIRLNTPELTLRHAANSVSVSGKLDKTFDLDFAINVAALEQTLAEAKGKIIGGVQVTGSLDEPVLDVDLQANTLEYQELASISALSLQGRLIPLPSPSGDIVLNIGPSTFNQQQVESINLAFKGTQQQHKLRLDLSSEIVSGGLTVDGGLKLKPDLNWQGELSDAHFTTMQGEWRLDHVPSLGYDLTTGLANVESHCWLQAGSRVCLVEDIEVGEQGQAKLAIEQFDFAQLKAFIPQQTQLNGQFDLQAEVKWSADAPPQAKAALTLSPGGVTQNLEPALVLGWNSITLNASLADDDLRSDWTIDFKDNGSVSGVANIDNVTLEQREIDANLKLSELNLSPLQPLVGEFSEVGAMIEADIALSGPIMKPRANGYFVISDILASGEITPVEVTEGEIKIDFSGYQAALNSRIVTQEGQLNMEGDADWQQLEDWSTNLKIFADELQVSVEPLLVATLQPDLKISVVPGQITLRGDIALPYGRVTVEELPESAISVSGDEIILDKDLNQVTGESAVPFNVDSNINITIGDEVRLAAFGLKGSLVGDLSVTQKDQAPFIIGEINIIDGSYRSFGQDLLIDEGKILFNGPADQPYLSIKAIRNPDNTEDNVIAGVTVTGPADEPEVSIFSDPAMPQANALSYVLRGQDIDGDSGGDAMTTALIGLSLAKSGKVVGEIGEAFGVQDLQLDTEGSGDDSQVTVSGYILPRLQVKYGVGIFESIGEFTLRYRLMKDLYVEAVSGADNALDILYQFQFD